MRRKLALIDGHSLIYRAYFALPGFTTTKGVPTGAVYGFTMMLIRLLEDEKPDLVAAAFDRAAPTFRHERFDGYKANRPEMADDLRPQVPLAKEVLEAFGIPIFEMDGFEADDIIGTLAARGEERGLDVLVVTGDRDALQLVSPSTSVLIMKKGITEVEKYDLAAVRSRFGVEPRQLVEIKALMGDKSDNIPGVPGIGEKTAEKLIQQFGSVEELLRRVAEVGGRPGKLLAEHADQARMSRELAEIDRRVPVNVEWDKLSFEPAAAEAVGAVFERLEFRVLKRRLDSGQLAGVAKSAIKDVRQDARDDGAEDKESERVKGGNGLAVKLWRVVGNETGTPAGGDSEEKRYDGAVSKKDALSRIAAAPRVGIALDLGGDDPLRAPVDGVAVAVSGAAATTIVPIDVYYFCGADAGAQAARYISGSKSGYDLKRWLLSLEGRGALGTAGADEVDEAGEVGKIGEAGKVAGAGEPAGHRAERLYLGDNDFDVMIAGYLLSAGRESVSVDGLARHYLELEVLPDADGGSNGTGKHDGKAKGAGGPRRTAREAAISLLLTDALAQELRKVGMWELFREVEMPLVPILARMEATGVAIDVAKLAELSEEFGRRLAELEEEIFRLAGEPFNINSPKQLATILFEKLHLKTGKKTKSGYSTDAEVLAALAEQHPIAGLILSYRELVKLKSTYVDVLPQLIYPATGRVHTTFNQAVTATGRLSSANPNLQNIPVRREEGARIREAFVAGRPGWVLLSADYSQIELRVLAHVAADPVLIDAFRSGQDIHVRAASEVFGVPPEEVTPAMRNAAKAINFGIVYGISSFGLAKGTGITQEEARKYIDGYFARYQGVAEYKKTIVAFARERGYVTTMFGRRRYLPGINGRNWPQRAFAERTALNTPIQGTAADIIKKAMLRADKAVRAARLPAYMILQVHDELVFEVREDAVEAAAKVIRDAMENAVSLRVPLIVGMECGPNWLETEKLDI